MASFVDDIGEALETALKAGSASFSGAVDSPQGTLAIFYNDTPEQGNFVGGSCYLRFAGSETIEEFADSARSTFTFNAKFSLADVAGKNKALSVVNQGMRNVFADKGRTVLNTHLTDNGSNRLGKSGRISYTLQAEPIESLNDYDQAVVSATIAVDVWHKIPLA